MTGRPILKLPPAISAEHLKGGGTTGMVALLPGQTVIKFPHGEPDDIVRLRKEGDIYERFQKAKRRPRSLLQYRGRTKDGILLEYAERGSVREYLRSQTSAPSSILLLRWAEQAAEALAFSHANGVLHGDINCSNYFLTQQLELKLGDFATSAMDGPTTSLYSITHQLADADITSSQTEIFAFGSSLYEMVTGRAPYADLDYEEVESRFRQKQFPDLSIIRVLGGTVGKCWMLEFDNMEDVLEAIKAECKDPITHALQVAKLIHLDSALSTRTPSKSKPNQSTVALLFSAVLVGHVLQTAFLSGR
ncbi:MAG: hypothetical protein M1837_000379 [Sclerophora amabilis]|nr:MAG: hypothetical protein M1837_000379 [Sclerophora amabilis]